MARPREFDEEAALEQATQVFWEKGYKRTSMEDLLSAMQIRKGSLYNTFGSKRELYLRCLERYRDGAMMGEGPFGAVLNAVRSGPAALREVFSKQLDGLSAGDVCSGCFVASASLETRGLEGDVLNVTKASVEEATDALAAAIAEAQQEGTMPPELAPQVLARLFITLGYGSQVLAAAGMSKEELLGSLGTVFEMLQGRNASASSGT